MDSLDDVMWELRLKIEEIDDEVDKLSYEEPKKRQSLLNMYTGYDYPDND